ncbi:hypothetical protein [Novosphingobium sp. CCH12-A3]|uniref:hypothetical protein n=1 Tax=Novosphingobium sp. CCH12-A3 TaxID=1768752 RepID=UPI00078336CD|nr:hypothetical protein [Novosphingobium sp. CCH12-A3]
MRPATIRAFEISVIASQLLRIGVGVLFSGRLAETFQVAQTSVVQLTIANVVVELGLGLAISRGKMSLARWFLLVAILFDVLDTIGVPGRASVIGILFAVMSILATMLMLAAGVLMFLPASTAWLKQDKAG